MDAVAAEIREIIGTLFQQIEMDHLSDDTSLREVGVSSLDFVKIVLAIDSLELTSLVVGLEDTFGFIFEDTDLDPAKIRTVGDVVRLVFFYNHGYIEEDKKHASVGGS